MENSQKNQVKNQDQVKDQVKDQVDVLKKQNPQPFRGVIIPITEKGKYGMQLSSNVTLLEAYGVLSLIMEQLRKELGVTN